MDDPKRGPRELHPVLTQLRDDLVNQNNGSKYLDVKYHFDDMVRAAILTDPRKSTGEGVDISGSAGSGAWARCGVTTSTGRCSTSRWPSRCPSPTARTASALSSRSTGCTSRVRRQVGQVHTEIHVTLTCSPDTASRAELWSSLTLDPFRSPGKHNIMDYFKGRNWKVHPDW